MNTLPASLNRLYCLCWAGERAAPPTVEVEMLQGDDVFEETFDCGWCERENVFTIKTTDFKQIGDNSGTWGWSPKFKPIEKTCPNCGEKTEYGMDVETSRGKEYLIIYDTDL